MLRTNRESVVSRGPTATHFLTVCEQRPLWKTQLVAVLGLAGVKSFSIPENKEKRSAREGTESFCWFEKWTLTFQWSRCPTLTRTLSSRAAGASLPTFITDTHSYSRKFTSDTSGVFKELEREQTLTLIQASGIRCWQRRLTTASASGQSRSACAFCARSPPREGSPTSNSAPSRGSFCNLQRTEGNQRLEVKASGVIT